MTPRPSIEVAVIMRHERIDNRWQPWRWVLDDVVPQQVTFGSEPRILHRSEEEVRWLHPGVGAWILRRHSVRLAALIKRPPPATCPTNSTPITAIIFRRCGTSCVTGPNMNRDFATVAA